MINLYRTTITVETYVLANRPEDAAHTIARAYPEGKSITQVVDARAELVAEVRDDAKAKRPNLGCYIINDDIPAERGEWTCAQWAAALRDDLATEATRLRGEAGAAEKRAAELRAKAAALEALARPSAPAEPAVPEIAVPEIAESIEDACERFAAYMRQDYHDCSVGHDGTTLHLYVPARRPHALVVETFHDFPVNTHFGVQPVPASEPLHPDMFGGTDYPEDVR